MLNYLVTEPLVFPFKYTIPRPKVDMETGAELDISANDWYALSILNSAGGGFVHLHFKRLLRCHGYLLWHLIERRRSHLFFGRYFISQLLELNRGCAHRAR